MTYRCSNRVWGAHTHKYPPPLLIITTYYQVYNHGGDMSISVFGSIGGFIKKSMSAGSSAASALDYSMKTLESQAFMFNIKSQSEAMKDKDALALLNNYMLTEDDSDNIKKFVTAAKLMNQQQVQTPSNVSSNTLTNNLVRR